MMSASIKDLQLRIQQLEKENRILQKKLERSDQICLQLEETTRKKESLLRQVIAELKESQTTLGQQRQELEQTLTHLKRTQIQLVQAEKMSSLGQLVAGVAHEINNPVNFIHGNLKHVGTAAQQILHVIQLYQTHYPDPHPEIQAIVEEMDLVFLSADLSKMLNSMKLGTDRIRQIVLSLRNFSRIDESALKSVNIHEGIDNTLLILQHRLKERSQIQFIQVVREYDPIPLVECYPSQLNQAFMNILVNAIDALEEANLSRTCQEIQENPSQITIQTSLIDSTWVQITILDNGIGMSPWVQNQIFNPFFTTKTIGKGTGMGMPISYQIVTETHGGKLDCFSVLGQGTTFTIVIPIRQSSPNNH